MPAPLSSAAPAQGAEITSDLEPEPAIERLEPAAVAEGEKGVAAAEGHESVVPDETWDEREAVRAAANRELRTDLLGPGVDRLAAIALVSAGLLGLYLALLSAVVPKSTAPWTSLWPNYRALLIAAIVASLGLYGVTRIRRLRPQSVHDLGAVYLVVLALLLALMRHARPWPATELVRQVSPVVFPILAFGALIPAPPKRALLVSLAAAAMDPLALALMRPHEPAHLDDLVLLFASPFLAALVAHRISLVVHRLKEGIVKAREVGSYSLVERLGVGGMAEVWRANHRMLARPAAVKLIRPQVLIDYGPQDAERLLRLFSREARTTASLKSPHTIELYDFGISREGAFYYVMELLDGLDLKTLVDRFGPQPEERVAHWLGQALHSLAEAHERSFVHRDVKPANLYACKHGIDYDFVKVLDFGLVLDRHPTVQELEDEKRFVGTPAVMAPEMVRFQAPVDARADIYAIGCVGYFALTGKRVFEATSRHDLLVMHAHQRPILPSKRIGKELHHGLEALIMACLEKNPNRRPQTARELRESLAALKFVHAWTEERAKLWWRTHLERPVEREPEAQPESADAKSPVSV